MREYRASRDDGTRGNMQMPLLIAGTTSFVSAMLVMRWRRSRRRRAWLRAGRLMMATSLVDGKPQPL